MGSALNAPTAEPAGDGEALPPELLGIAQAHRRHGHPEPRQGAGQTIPTCRLCEEEVEAEVRAVLASDWLAARDARIKAEGGRQALLDLAAENPTLTVAGWSVADYLRDRADRLAPDAPREAQLPAEKGDALCWRSECHRGCCYPGVCSERAHDGGEGR